MFTATIEWYNDYDEKIITEVIVVHGENFADAMKNIEKTYKTSLESVRELAWISDCEVLSLGVKGEVDENELNNVIAYITANNGF
jgi:hypothetical protein